MIKNYNKKVIEDDERIKREKNSKGKWITYFEEKQMIRDYNKKNNNKISRGKPVERNKEWD
jgi:hypothetical protein